MIAAYTNGRLNKNNPVLKVDSSGGWESARFGPKPTETGAVSVEQAIEIDVGVGLLLFPSLYVIDGILFYNEINSEVAASDAAATATKETSGASIEGTGKFTQTTASPYFSDEGLFSGKTIDQVSQEIRSGDVSGKNVPVQYMSEMVINTY